MSGELSERDRQVLEVSTNDSAKTNRTSDLPTDTEELQSLVRRFATELEETQEELQATKDELEATQNELAEFKQEAFRKINQLEDAIEGDVNAVGSTTLEKYASMPPEVREDTLGPSERRAVEIYLNWDERPR